MLELQTLNKSKFVFVDLLSDNPDFYETETITPDLSDAISAHDCSSGVELAALDFRQHALNAFSADASEAEQSQFTQRFKEAFLAGDCRVAQENLNKLIAMNKRATPPVWGKAMYEELMAFMRETFQSLLSKMDGTWSMIQEAEHLGDIPHVEQAMKNVNVYVHYFYCLRDFQTEALVPGYKNTVCMLDKYLQRKIKEMMINVPLPNVAHTALNWIYFFKIRQHFVMVQKFKTAFQLPVFAGDVSHYFIKAYDQAYDHVQKPWSDCFESLFNDAMVALKQNNWESVFDTAAKMRLFFLTESDLGPYLSNADRYETLKTLMRRYFYNAKQLIVADMKHVKSDFYEALYQLSSVKRCGEKFTDYTGITYAETDYQSDLGNIKQCLQIIIEDIQKNRAQWDTQAPFLQCDAVLSCLKNLATLEEAAFSPLDAELKTYMQEAYQKCMDTLTRLSEQALAATNKMPVVLLPQQHFNDIAQWVEILSVSQGIESLCSLGSSIPSKQRQFLLNMFRVLEKISQKITPETAAETLYEIVMQFANIQALLKSKHPHIGEDKKQEKSKMVNEMSSRMLAMVRDGVSEALSVDEEMDMDYVGVNIDKKHINLFHFLLSCYQSKQSRQLLSFFNDKDYTDYRLHCVLWIQQIKKKTCRAIAQLKVPFTAIEAKSFADSISVVFTTLMKVDSLSIEKNNKYSRSLTPSIIDALEKLDKAIIYPLLDCLAKDESVASLYQDVLNWVMQRERTNFAELQACIQHGNYARFIELYSTIEHARYVHNIDKGNATASAVYNIKAAITAALVSSNKPSFHEIDEAALPLYFLTMAELGNYRAILSQFEIQDASDEYALFMDQLSKAYQAQVANFINNVPASDVIAIYRYITYVKNALTFSSDIHQILNDAILQQVDKIASILRHLCDFYEKATPDTYSAELVTLFDFLASLKDDPGYGNFYTQLTTNLQHSILSFIDGKASNYGWDISEHIAIITEKHDLIPAVIWHECAFEMSQQKERAQSLMNKEWQTLSLLSIHALMDRLARATNATYQGIVTQQLHDLVQATLQTIAGLQENNFLEAIQTLNDVWLELDRFFKHTQENNKLNALFAVCYQPIIERFNATYDVLFTALDTHEAASFSAIADAVDTTEVFAYLFQKNSALYQHIFLDALHDKSYTQLLQKIAAFYVALKKKCHTSLENHDFFQPFFFMAQLHHYQAIFEKLFAMMSDVGIQVPHSHFDNFYGEIKRGIAEKFGLLLPPFDVLQDEQFWRGLADKEAFYTQIALSYNHLMAYCAAANTSDCVAEKEEAIKAYTQITQLIATRLQNMHDTAIVITQSKSSMMNHDYHSFHEAYENLKILQQVWPEEGEIKSAIDNHVAALDNVIFERIKQHMRIVENRSEATQDAIIDVLLKLQHMSISLAHFKDAIVTVINQLLEEVQEGEFPQCPIVELGAALTSWSGDGGLSRMLLEEYPIFNEFVTAMRNKKTAFANIDYVCNKLSANPENTNLDVDALKTRQEQFAERYWEQVNVGLKMSLADFTTPITQCVQSTLADRTMAYPDKMVSLMAFVFAYWSVNDYKKRSDSNTTTELPAVGNRHSIRQPLPAQVTSIFRLLGIDVTPQSSVLGTTPNKREYLSNHLVEILTGEGKSVTLAITAILFALMGYDVDCACYSRYLTDRDLASFSHLFEVFGIKDNIFYGTFKDLCERWFNEQHDVRQTVDSQIRQTYNASVGKARGNKRILLIDEVDVFFGEDFCGSAYHLSHIFAHPDVNALIRFIWEASALEKKTRLSDVKNEPAYDALVKKLMPGFEKVLEQAILTMIEDAKVYRKTQGSFIFDEATQRIGYQTNSHEVEYVNRRYLTMFAYIDYYDNGNGKITQQALSAKIGLLIECGQFSYAEILKHYRYVFGVTGTLTTLTPQEKALVNTILKTEKFTYMPSSYEAPRFCFDKKNAVFACEADDYFEAITAEIMRQRNHYDETIDKRNIRPVMVFFESLVTLSAYLDYVKDKISRSHDEVDALSLEDISILTEKETGQARDNLIKRATSAGNITLLTAPYGRGTDFICYDKKVEEYGGSHVLLTFLPSDAAEDTQFQGRTARQGGAGSYSMVLNIADLQARYQYNQARLDWINEAKDGEGRYAAITHYRNQYLEKQYEGRQAKLSEIAKKHHYSMQFVEQLITPKVVRHVSATFFSSLAPQVEDFLYTLNEFQSKLPPVTVYRTVCLIDATGSMRLVLNAVKDTVAQMFERTQTILAEAGRRETDEVEMQFVFYRNYNAYSHNLLLECSEWTTGEDCDTLKDFLSHVVADYGLGNEAAEVAFAHVNALTQTMKIEQIIWIGDMPPNNKDEVDSRRRANGVRKAPFSDPVYFDSELAKIKQAKIPVHGVYVQTSGNYKSAYEKASAQTGGTHFVFNPNTPDNAQQLAEIIIKRVLNNIGGDQLVAAYDQKYVTSHTGSAAAISYAPKQEAVSGAAVSSAVATIIKREDIKAVLTKYIASRIFHNIPLFHKEEGGLLTAKRILRMIGDENTTDEDIFRAFKQWENAPDAKNRGNYTSTCALYGNEEKPSSLSF